MGWTTDLISVAWFKLDWDVIPLVNGGWHEARDLLIRNKGGLVGRDQDNSLELLKKMVHPARLERATP